MRMRASVEGSSALRDLPTRQNDRYVYIGHLSINQFHPDLTFVVKTEIHHLRFDLYITPRIHDEVTTANIRERGGINKPTEDSSLRILTIYLS